MEPTRDTRFVSARVGQHVVEFPLATFVGAMPGRTLAVIAGMHGGEYSGVLAAIQLIRTLDVAQLSGRLLVVPVLSTEAFMQRNMQLSPIDQREVHYTWPGSPSDGYSECLVDLVFETVRHADAVIDLHAGEFAQDLSPYVCVPWEADGDLWQRSLALAGGFEVPFVDRRAVAETPLALPRALLRENVPNVWTEIGHNGLPQAHTIELQYAGVVNNLRRLGMLPGEHRDFAPREVGPRHWTLYAERSGVWATRVRAGEKVRAGQPLGELTDYFGQVLATYHAEADALVEYVATAAAINVDRQPHGYRWHQLLVQLVEDPLRPVA